MWAEVEYCLDSIKKNASLRTEFSSPSLQEYHFSLYMWLLSEQGPFAPRYGDGKKNLLPLPHLTIPAQVVPRPGPPPT